MCFASEFYFLLLLYFITLFFHLLLIQIQSWPEVIDWQVQRQKFAFAVPFILVTVYMMCSIQFLLLLVPMVDFSLNFLGMLVGYLDFCASSLLHLHQELAGPVLFIQKVSRSEAEASSLPGQTVL